MIVPMRMRVIHALLRKLASHLLNTDTSKSNPCNEVFSES